MEGKQSTTMNSQASVMYMKSAVKSTDCVVNNAFCIERALNKSAENTVCK